MMLIKSFIAKELIDFLEKELESREPQLQKIMIDGVAHEISKLTDWINKKISDNPKITQGASK